MAAVWRNSCGGVLPRGRTASISGSQAAHSASVSLDAGQGGDAGEAACCDIETPSPLAQHSAPVRQPKDRSITQRRASTTTPFCPVPRTTTR